MKTFFTTVAIIFLGSVFAILLTGFISRSNRLAVEKYIQMTAQTSSDQKEVLPVTPSPQKDMILTKEVVARHNTQGDCWIIVSGKVYSVSSYLSMHPGGRSVILERCGKDATTAFSTRGGEGKHSSSAWSILGTFFVGTLGTTPLTQVSAPTPKPSSVINPVPKPTSIPTPSPVTNPKNSYTAAQVALHSSPSDCWIIVNGNVYSVASYISLHPGGRTKITDRCGKDATSGYNNQGHSSNADSILGGFLVGPYSSTASVSSPVTSVSPTVTTTTSGSSKTTYTVSVNSSGFYDVTNLVVRAGDAITIQYVAPREDEIKTQFTPSPPSTVTLDDEKISRTVTFTTPGTYTFKAKERDGNVVTVVVQ